MSHPVILPKIDIVERWQQCHRRDDLRLWRSTAFLCSSAALMAKEDGNSEAEQNCLALFELGMQHVYRLSVPETEAA
jgi:hypothetical protein